MSELGLHVGRKGPWLVLAILVFFAAAGYFIFPEGASCRGTRPGHEPYDGATSPDRPQDG